MLALSVGFTRIYAGVHYPLAVLADIIVGIVISYALLAIARMCKIRLD